MVTKHGCAKPQNFPYCAIDNMAYSAYRQKKEWDGSEYQKYICDMYQRCEPDFIVIPDVVAEGKKSLQRSLEWLDKLEWMPVSKYFVVQDGMTENEIEIVASRINGIFVGGSYAWKMQTVKFWKQISLKYNKKIHVGRIGTKQNIEIMRILKIDSIDSTSWPRHNTWNYIIE